MIFLAEGGVILTTTQIVAAVTVLSGAVALLYKTQQSNNAREIQRMEKNIADLESSKKSFEKVAGEAVEAATQINNYLRAQEGKPPLLPIAPVVTESNSPSTAAQRDSAILETLKAKVEAIRLGNNQPPRPEPEQAPIKVTKKE